uniref:AAA+ ATPase domain-containing protein n=1 Tax=viral metagenome TaxID=1070528 RepID=A0A6C0JZ98_9ZZZZ
MTSAINGKENALSCNSDIFNEINEYAKNHESIKNAVIEANVLYNNGKFYYSSGESVGALVSYSCATVLLNSVLQQIKITEDETASQVVLQINKIMNSLLQVIQSLQQKVGSNKSGDKDDNEKDWAKICTKIKPLVFKKGSNDCIFYSDVAGLAAEKKTIDSSLVYPLIYPNLYPKTSKGILIYGPPGTGKTYLVKAAVNELQKKDDSVGVLFFAPSPGDLKGKYVGETEKRIEEIFRCARDAACEHQAGCPGNKKYISIIFMDEMDAIAPDRDKDTTGLAVNSVNTLLQMMDGIKSFPNVTVVAATNYPWNLDAAILRRFDTQLLINVPNERELKELFNIEMNRFIDLDVDKSNFNYCDTIEKKQDDESSNLSCDLECRENPSIEKHRIYPYSKFNIEYFSNNKKGGLIDGIIYLLKKDNFSNSDLNRLIKAAATNAGEMAVNQSLFYSSKLIGDFRHDNYISALTGINFTEEVDKKNKGGQVVTNASGLSKKTLKIDSIKNVNLSIEILKAFEQGKTPENVIQLNSPDFFRIQHENHYYYNTKCLLYKNNDVLIQHHSISDIYIKGNPIDVTLDAWKNNSSKSTNTDTYYTNILGTTKDNLENEKTADDFGEIDIVIAFDFTFKENNMGSSVKSLMPIYRDLINYVFQPIYNEFLKNKTRELDETKITGESKSDKWENFLEKAQPKGQPIFSNSVSTDIINNGKFQENEWNPLLNDIFSSVKPHNLDFYNFLLLQNLLLDKHGDNTKKFEEGFSKPHVGGDGMQRSVSAPANLQTPANVQPSTPAPASASSDSSDDDTADSDSDAVEFSEVLDENTVNNYLNIINYHEKINIVNNDSIKPELEIKTYTLSKDGSSFPVFYYTSKTDDNEITKFRINVKQYKSLITNVEVYEFFGELLTNYDNLFIDINQNLFEILFKDAFSDIKITTTDPEEFAEIWTPNTLVNRLMQLYINDVIKMYYLQLDIIRTQTKTTITGFNDLSESELKAVLFGYLLVVFNSTNVTPEIISQYSLLLLYDNYLLSVPQTGQAGVARSFLGQSISDSNKLENTETFEKITKMKKYQEFFDKLDATQQDIDKKQSTEQSDTSLGKKSNSRNKKGKKPVITKKRVVLGVFAALAIGSALYFSGATQLPLGQGNAPGPVVGQDSSLVNANPGANFTNPNFTNPNFNYTTGNANNSTADWHNGFGGRPRTHKNVTQHTKMTSSLKNKKKSKSKGNSLKNKKLTPKKRTQTMRKRPMYTGGAPDEQIDGFIKWCNDNKEKVSLSAMASGDLGPIARKKIFVKTTFNRAQLKLQRRRGAFVAVVGMISWIPKGIYNTLPEWIITKEQKIKNEAARKDEFNKILQKIKETNALLPICFNNVDAIGLVNTKIKSVNKITDDKELIETATNEQKINLDWQYLENTKLWFSFRDLAETMFGLGQGVEGEGIENILGAAATCVGLFIFGGYVSAAAVGTIVVCNIVNAYKYWSGKSEDKENIIKNALMQSLFNVLTEIRYFECNKFQGKDALDIFLDELDKICRESLTFFSNKSTPAISGSQTAAAAQGQGRSSTDLTIYKNKNVVGKDIKNKLVNLNIPMQSFYHAMNIVKTTYNLETGPLLVQYYENRELFLENYKKKEAKKK